MSRRSLIKLIKTWFRSDLDIEFRVTRNGYSAICIFESDAYYSYDPVQRHGGDHRRFIVVKDNDKQEYDILYKFCHALLDMKDAIETVHTIADRGFRFWP